MSEMTRTMPCPARILVVGPVLPLPIQGSVTPDLSAVAIRVSGGQDGPQTKDVITAIRSDRPSFETFVTGPAAA